MTNRSFVREKAAEQQEAEDVPTEVCGRVEAVEAKVERLKVAFAKAEANLASEKERRAKVVETKKKLVEAEKRIEERFVKVGYLVVEYKALIDFAAKKA